jgi:4-amino-4-deoxy-L-arabinose transferase-like glycosyltransferase
MLTILIGAIPAFAIRAAVKRQLSTGVSVAICFGLFVLIVAILRVLEIDYPAAMAIPVLSFFVLRRKEAEKTEQTTA